eukprot:gene28885-37898_t
MDSQQFGVEEICLDVMTTKEHLEYILNYPEKPLISTTRFPKLGRKSLDYVSPIKISPSPKGTVDSKYFIGQEASRRSPASSSSYSIALRHMMNGDLNPASPLQPPKDGTVQFVENLYSRLSATSTTPLLKAKTRSKTNTRFSYPMPDNMEHDLPIVSHNGDNSNPTDREGEVSYVKSVINFYERKENIASRPFSAVVTNDVATSDIQEIAADVPISNSSDYDSNGIIPLNTEKSDDDHSGNNSSDDSSHPQGQQEIGDPPLDRPETSNLHQTIEIAIVESVDAIVETICTNSANTSDSKNEDEKGNEEVIPTIDRSQSLLEEEIFESCDNPTAPSDTENNERQQEDEATYIDDENTSSTSVSLELLPESSISLPHTAVEPIHEIVIVASPEASVEEMQGESKFSSLSDADGEHANQNISESIAIEASEPVPGIEELSPLLGSDDQSGNFSEVQENLADSEDSAVQESSTANNQNDIDGSESRHDENQDSLLLGSVVSLQTVPTSYCQIISSDAVLPYADTSIVTDAYDSISSSEADNQEYTSTVTVDNDNDKDSPSQVQSAVDVDSSNNIVVKKQLQFVTVEYSRSNGGDYLELHTATLSEYNQQPDVKDSSVFEPVEISFDFEPIENSVELECHEKTSNQSICVGIEIDLKVTLHGDEVEREAVVDKKPSKVYKPALFGGCRSFLNF